MNRGRAVLALVLAVALVAAACSGDDDGGDAAPRPTDTPVTAVVDYSSVPLRAVDGTTTTTGPREQGTASIIGSVAGPSGLLVGATVRIERLLGAGEVRTDVLTGPDGRFELRNVPGGRYRVRAFLAPALAMVTPDVRFLRDGQEHTFDLVTADQRGIVVRASAAPDPPVLDAAVNVAAVLASKSVDADGIVRSTPVVGVRVELSGTGRWSFRSSVVPNPGRPLLPTSSTSTTVFRAQSGAAFTDGLGQVHFEMRCDVAGPPGLSLLVPVTVQPEPVEGQAPLPPTTRIDALPLDLPECVDPAAVTAPAEGESDDADEDSE